MNLEATRTADSWDPTHQEQVALPAVGGGARSEHRFPDAGIAAAALDHLGCPPRCSNWCAAGQIDSQNSAEFDAVGIDGLRLSHDAEANLYRFTQEALHNIVKHAAGTHLTVILQREDEQQIMLIVEDNGRGFAIEDAERQTGAGLGLGTMGERALLLGGGD